MTLADRVVAHLDSYLMCNLYLVWATFQLTVGPVGIDWHCEVSMPERWRRRAFERERRRMLRAAGVK